MARSFVINGECLIQVKGGAQFTGLSDLADLTELGLTTDQVKIVPKFYHHDLHVDDFGPNVPVETLWMMAEVHVHMTLIHYDKDILESVIAESMGGSPNRILAGRLAPAGIPMMGNIYQDVDDPLKISGCHYVGLNITSPVLSYPWYFYMTYLPAMPLEIPLGAKYTAVNLSFRCLPFRGLTASGEIVSSGAIIYDHLLRL